MLKIAFYTLGCKVNTYETDVMTAAFIKSGAEIVPFLSKADCYIVNTCTVTHISDKKSRKMLRTAKRRNENAIVVAVGCYAQVAQEELKKIPEIDLVIGNVGKSEIVSRVHEFMEGGQARPVADMATVSLFENMQTIGSRRTRAVMKIEDGCNNFCTYCIIPRARGKVRSKPLAECVEEFESLCKEGYLEIVLTGIEIALYGSDIETNLMELLEKLDQIAAQYEHLRVRLGSLEPRLITPEFAEKVGRMKFLCPHFHLSLQSGSDSVLRRMGRKYTTEEYEQACRRLRDNIPDVSFTTDIIVGFPGESEEEFLETSAFAQKIGFLKVHIFPYSKREGTPAAKLQQVNPQIVSQRVSRLAKTCEVVHRKFMEGERGKLYPVLFEGGKNGVYTGHTPNYIEVSTKSETDLHGTIKNWVL